MRRAILLVVCLVALAGCSRDQQQPFQPLPTASLAPDFTLPDVNPNSPTTGLQVSARDQLGKVSAWYFGHAT